MLFRSELFAYYDRAPLTISVDLTRTRATEGTADGGTQEVALTPRHTFGLDVAIGDADDGSRVAFELFMTGPQRVEHDPSREVSPAYTEVGLLVSQRVGRATLYLNGENLTDVRQSSHGPVRLTPPSAVGRLTVDAWGPSEGRAINAGVQWRF